MISRVSSFVARNDYLRKVFRFILEKTVNPLFFWELIEKTNNFSGITWLGQPIWQNVLDLWTIQETIYQIKPQLLVESGTNRGGSAFFYAQLFDLMGHGRIITIDVEKMHNLAHPRIEFLIGGSTSAKVVENIQNQVRSTSGPVMVILDSDHSEAHVSEELELYSSFVTPNSYLLVQDGVIDTLARFQHVRPGPLPAIKNFLKKHPEFQEDEDKNRRFLITHHPMGWLRKLDGVGKNVEH
jgi:cephalosporin hydroxylase